MRDLYCYRHPEDDYAPVLMDKDINAARWVCPREGCDQEYTAEYVVEHSCQRCGDGPDPDLRTLWMACFYEMFELDIPLRQVAMRGRWQKETARKTDKWFPHGIPTFEDDDSEAEPQLYRFYTMRVCKNCRADWMQAIKGWFQAPATDDEINEGDTPIRVLGAVRRMQ